MESCHWIQRVKRHYWKFCKNILPPHSTSGQEHYTTMPRRIKSTMCVGGFSVFHINRPGDPIISGTKRGVEHDPASLYIACRRQSQFIGSVNSESHMPYTCAREQPAWSHAGHLFADECKHRNRHDDRCVLIATKMPSLLSSELTTRTSSSDSAMMKYIQPRNDDKKREQLELKPYLCQTQRAPKAYADFIRCARLLNFREHRSCNIAWSYW